MLPKAFLGQNFETFVADLLVNLSQDNARAALSQENLFSLSEGFKEHIPAELIPEVAAELYMFSIFQNYPLTRWKEEDLDSLTVFAQLLNRPAVLKALDRTFILDGIDKFPQEILAPDYMFNITNYGGVPAYHAMNSHLPGFSFLWEGPEGTFMRSWDENGPEVVESDTPQEEVEKPFDIINIYELLEGGLQDQKFDRRVVDLIHEIQDTFKLVVVTVVKEEIESFEMFLKLLNRSIKESFTGAALNAFRKTRTLITFFVEYWVGRILGRLNA